MTPTMSRPLLAAGLLVLSAASTGRAQTSAVGFPTPTEYRRRLVQDLEALTQEREALRTRMLKDRPAVRTKLWKRAESLAAASPAVQPLAASAAETAAAARRLDAELKALRPDDAKALFDLDAYEALTRKRAAADRDAAAAPGPTRRPSGPPWQRRRKGRPRPAT